MRGIGNVVIGGLFVFGGLSGGMVLKGTSSSGALALVGAVLMVIGLFRLASGSQTEG